MTLPTDEDHGPGLRLAQSDLGAVSVCACGVITLTLRYLSLRLEPDAFRSLAQMLGRAQARLDGPACQQPVAGPPTAADSETAAPELPPQHSVH